MVVALLGAIIGMSRVVKIMTSGVFGLIISILCCYSIGQMFMSIPAIAELVAYVHTRAIEAWELFKFINVGIIAYYVGMFLIIQIARKLTVAIFKRIMEAKLPIVRFLNRALGSLSAVAFAFIGVLVFFAVVQIIIDSETGRSFLDWLGSGFMRRIFDANPIRF
jgi:hypothetical protein